MKRLISSLFISFIIAAPLFAQGSALTERMQGKIVLQVEERGEAWYVNPVNRLRYYLGRPTDAFRIMRELGLGISEADYERYRNNPPSRLEGRIVIRVEADGEAYYVDAVKNQFVYLGRPADAFRVMRERGLGISNDNLDHMPIAGASVIPPSKIMNINVFEPDWNDKVENSVVVSGEARVFEGVVNIRIKNSNDQILAESSAMTTSSGMGEFGSFKKSVNYSSTDTTFGYLEVFAKSAKDGSEIYKVITLIRF